VSGPSVKLTNGVTFAFTDKGKQRGTGRSFGTSNAASLGAGRQVETAQFDILRLRKFTESWPTVDPHTRQQEYEKDVSESSQPL
jgi:hypothetical protein